MSQERKQQLRRAVRERLRSVNVGRESTRICDRVGTLAAWANATAATLYAPLWDEPDVRPLFDGLGRLAARVRDDGGLDVASALEPPPGEGWRRGTYGIWEPVGPALDVATLDFVLVPGVAFTRNGQRLGRGKGYYDRFLATLAPTCFTCGVCFDCQLLDDLPTEPHDVPLDAVVTASGVYRRTDVDAGE